MPWLLKMTLFAAAIKAVVDLYLGWRIIRAVDFLGSSMFGNWSWAVVFFFVVFYLLPLSGLLQYLFGVNVDILTYPKPLLYLFWFGFAFSFQVLLWVVLLDVFKLLANATGVNAPQLEQLYGVLVLGVSLIVFCYTAYKMYADTNHITTEQVTLVEQKLPAVLDGFKIVHITDIQADRYTGASKIERYIQQVNQQNPDLVVVTGDLISYGTDYVDMAAEELARIQAPYGTYFVIGDHDYWAGSEHIKKALVEQGINVLEAKNEYLKNRGYNNSSVRAYQCV
ncbi:MAG: metallophosphoesterase [Balneolaceae bacterium]|nr:metallophosphoesterase [Balneolaceae bacterium]